MLSIFRLLFLYIFTNLQQQRRPEGIINILLFESIPNMQNI